MEVIFSISRKNGNKITQYQSFYISIILTCIIFEDTYIVIWLWHKKPILLTLSKKKYLCKSKTELENTC